MKNLEIFENFIPSNRKEFTDSEIAYFQKLWDSLNQKYRYNQFLLEENDDPDRHSNEITLQSGEYIYEIYQAPEVAGFAPDNMTLVEIGCLIVSSLLTDTEYENESLTNTTYIG